VSNATLKTVEGLYALLDDKLQPITELQPAMWGWAFTASPTESSGWTYQIYKPDAVKVPSGHAAYYHGLYSDEGKIVAVLPIMGRPITPGTTIPI
jgi:hypothetical protein